MTVIQAIFAACYTEDICISYVAFVAMHIFFLFFIVTTIYNLKSCEQDSFLAS